eukprot:754376-Hanusia_phi.AAC.3
MANPPPRSYPPRTQYPAGLELSAPSPGRQPGRRMAAEDSIRSGPSAAQPAGPGRVRPGPARAGRRGAAAGKLPGRAQ